SPLRDRDFKISLPQGLRPGLLSTAASRLWVQKSMINRSIIVALLLSSLMLSGQQRSLYQQTQYKGQEIGKLSGDIYYARMDDYVSAFMVTTDGIILVEPIGAEMATWLKAELARRFNVPVKYVIYSHSHWDHASG